METSFFTFRLRRRPDQPGIDRALIHPTPDEWDDWVDCREIQDEKKNAVAAKAARLDHLTLIRVIHEMDGTHEEPILDDDDEDDWITAGEDHEDSTDERSSQVIIMGTCSKDIITPRITS